MNEDLNAPVPEGYKFLRNEVHFQHGQISLRSAVYLTSQSFLFVAAMQGMQYRWHGLYIFSGVLLPVLGLTISIFAAQAVPISLKRLAELRAKEQEFAESPWYLAVSEKLTRQSLLFARWTPKIIAIFWVLMIVLLPTLNVVKAN